MSKCRQCGHEVTFRHIGGIPVLFHLDGTCDNRSPYPGDVIKRAVRTRCPHCEELTYFVRHNGGSVYLDELGHPWPKHPCFEENDGSIRVLMNLEANNNGAIPLGELLRGKNPSNTCGGIKATYINNTYWFEGFDPCGETVLLRDCSTGQSKRFNRVVILEKTEGTKEAPQKHKVSQVDKLAGGVTLPSNQPRSDSDRRMKLERESEELEEYRNAQLAKAREGATSLGIFLRSKVGRKSYGTAKVTYKGKLYVFLGFDDRPLRVLLQEWGSNQVKPFLFRGILEQTAEERGKAFSAGCGK